MTASPAPTALGPQTPADVSLRVEDKGGLVASAVPAVPAVTLYADGHLVTADRATGPEPAITPLHVRTLAAGASERLLAAAEQARLGEGDYADPPMPDGGTTVVTYRHNGRTSRSVFTTLAPREQDTPDQAERRRLAAGYIAGLDHVEGLVGPDGVSAAEALKPDRLAISVRPALGGGTAKTKTWPVTSVPLDARAAAGPCTVLGGPDASDVAVGLAGEQADTLWRDAGRTWRVFLSPLLPDQPGCPA